jgi:hypothetical protein
MLLGALAVLAYTADGGWRQLYGQLLGASALYASSSYVANWAIGHKLYYSGSIYDIPLTVSIAWMAAVPLLALRLHLSDSKPSQASARHLDHAPEYACFVQPALGCRWQCRTGSRPSGFGQTFRITVSLVDHGRDGHRGVLAPTAARAELSLFLERSRRFVRRPQELAGKTHSIRETGFARPVGGRSRARDQQPAHRHAGILRTAQRVQLATRGTSAGRANRRTGATHHHAGCEPAHLCPPGSSQACRRRHQLRDANHGPPAGSANGGREPVPYASNSLPTSTGARRLQPDSACLHSPCRADQSPPESRNSLHPLRCTHSKGDVVWVDFSSYDPADSSRCPRSFRLLTPKARTSLLLFRWAPAAASSKNMAAGFCSPRPRAPRFPNGTAGRDQFRSPFLVHVPAALRPRSS